MHFMHTVPMKLYSVDEDILVHLQEPSHMLTQCQVECMSLHVRGQNLELIPRDPIYYQQVLIGSELGENRF